MRLFGLLFFPLFLFSASDSRLIGVLDDYRCSNSSCTATVTADGRYVYHLMGSSIYRDVLSSYRRGDVLESVCSGSSSIRSNCVFKIYSRATPSVNQKALAEKTSTIVIGELYDKK